MKKPQAIQISIPQPCSEDWQKMTPQDQGRYCDACKKCVVDFTGFTDMQLYDYFIQHAGEKTCGRFHNTQLNRPITIPAQPHSKLYRIAVALGLAVAIVTSAEQQSFAKALRIEYNFINNYHTDDTTQNNTDSTYATIKGQVVDENGEPLINAIIELSLGGIVKTGIVTDYNGNYIIKVDAANDSYELRIRYTGYKTLTTEYIGISIGQTVLLNVKMTPATNRDHIIIGGVNYRTPLIDPDNPGNGNRTINSYQIEKLAH